MFWDLFACYIRFAQMLTLNYLKRCHLVLFTTLSLKCRFGIFLFWIRVSQFLFIYSPFQLCMVKATRLFIFIYGQFCNDSKSEISAFSDSLKYGNMAKDWHLKANSLKKKEMKRVTMNLGWGCEEKGRGQASGISWLVKTKIGTRPSGRICERQRFKWWFFSFYFLL